MKLSGGSSAYWTLRTWELKEGVVSTKARLMFDGEYASLQAMHATGVVRVPKPMKVIDNPKGGAMLAMEYLDIKHLSRHAGSLGEAMARLHLSNSEAERRVVKVEGYVGRSEEGQYVSGFGFDVVTCCGYLPQDNTWDKSWQSFYANKLDFQLKKIEKEYNDKEARELWSKLQLQLPKFFEGLVIKPALMHGDLWGGNAGELDDCPVVFDPASFYGHSEYDLAIAQMFGGFSERFFNSYFKLLPKQPGYSDRLELYKLFHYLNHWNHFGSGYRGSSISIMKKLVK
ncbi:ketosamine-3-kinase-like isoform X2 [Mizuhopecten yessoensis]|uniref:ketosamine-3-kinase-like isoform X2 n=1 Tax=Mizuhopecten yessoensis TaxID=6573 RepID=UPI000B4577F0|nr:ketosamine-3-kinase-like isoform X2 [Mizuhopecten yessoensis]XP_021353946.1 ketosamine-3-kinase-like isoform X2 [Mizuhopecten yessoensis]